VSVGIIEGSKSARTAEEVIFEVQLDDGFEDGGEKSSVLHGK
jgi:hypothetical protein